MDVYNGDVVSVKYPPLKCTFKHGGIEVDNLVIPEAGIYKITYEEYEIPSLLPSDKMLGFRKPRIRAKRIGGKPK